MRPDGFNDRLLERLEVLLGDRGPNSEQHRALRVADQERLATAFFPRPRLAIELGANVALSASGAWQTVLTTGLSVGHWHVSAAVTVSHATADLRTFYARLVHPVSAVVYSSAMATFDGEVGGRGHTIPMSGFVIARDAAELSPLALQVAIDAGAPANSAAALAALFGPAGIDGTSRATQITAWRVE